MTANQIEYWKLNETRRHNIVTETMDKPVKESQAAYNYASIDLLREQARTQETVRALNLASAEASYASAAASYASAENQYAQAALNLERQQTEREQQKYVQQQTRGAGAKADYQEIVNYYAPQNLYNESKVTTYQGRKAEDMYAAWNRDPELYAGWGVLTESTGLGGGEVLSTGAKVFNTIYSN